MSEENVEIVREGFDVFSRRGAEAFLQQFAAPDGVWYAAPEFPGAHEHRGTDGLRFLFSTFADTFDEWMVEVVELRDAGDSVVALVEHQGKIKGTENPLRMPMAAVISDFRRDRIAGRIHFFLTWQEALEAAGLSE